MSNWKAPRKGDRIVVSINGKPVEATVGEVTVEAVKVIAPRGVVLTIGASEIALGMQ